MKMMEKVIYGSSAAAFALAVSIAPALAAPDSDLSSALASTSAIASDNKATIMNYIVAVGLVVLVIAIAKGGLNWAIGKIAGVFGRRRKR